MKARMKHMLNSGLLIAGLTALPLISHAAATGSGVYASDCDKPQEGYRIAIQENGDGAVQFGENTFMELLTAYSYYGDQTPQDFHIAVMFDREGSPFPPGADGDPRIEIWKGEAGYYALLNGDRKQRLIFCGQLDTPGASADMPYASEDYDVVGYAECAGGDNAPQMYCPFGVQRGDPGSATMVLRGPTGDERRFNFDGERVTGVDAREVTSQQENGMWLIQWSGEHYRFAVEVTGGE